MKWRYSSVWQLLLLYTLQRGLSNAREPPPTEKETSYV